MAINKVLSNSINFPASFLYAANAPLDARLIVDDEKDLKISSFVNSKGDSFYYEGMIVSCKGEAYILKSEAEGFKKIGGGLTPEETANLASKSDLNNYIKKDQIGNIFNFSGSYNSVLDLPTASEELLGKVYNIRNSFTVEEPVLNADGTPVLDENKVYTTKTQRYPAGTNVVCYKLEYTTPVLNEQGQPTTDPLSGEPVVDTHVYYIWDALGGITDWDWEEVN